MARKKKKKPFAVHLNEEQAFTVLRALTLAKDWVMQTAAPSERACAAAEAADYQIALDAMTAELVEQGLGKIRPPLPSSH